MGAALIVEHRPDGDDTPLRWGPNAARGGSAEDAIVIDDDTATAMTADANVEAAAATTATAEAAAAAKKVARQSS